ncbi:site-specific integrase [Geomonas paludis]|uniref:Site-specific integrase n=1 Tax=Geomonas paludis TaxID=2740185 RepID=A0ABY4LDG4_9BACT|nr:site-specific integrase [Geomonas paludis]UPU34492.1 site-specific integrase [Geomonas paludis]
MANYLRFRNQHYYLRIRIPVDLRSITSSPELLKSLHTQDHKVARLSAASLLPKVLEVFALTRTGFISQQQASERLDILMGLKQKAGIPSLPAAQSAAQAPSPSISKVIEEYVNDRQSAWTSKTLLEYLSYLRLLQDVLEVHAVSDISRDTVRKLRDTLCRLPANLYKKHPNKTIAEVLLMNDITPMSTTTVNKLLTLFGSLMRHCIKEGYRKDNPTEGLKVKHIRRPDEERKAYSREDLRKIMSALPHPTDKPERYWIPMIGMYSGMRLGEICGLRIADIRQVDGVWCFDVNEEGDKRLKTAASTRLVPIHPTLIHMGFISFVEKMKDGKAARLWPSLVRREVDGYCAAVGNWYGRFNRMYVTSDSLKTFHSLRHTFADALKQLGSQESLIAELMGHTNCNITTGRYGKRYQPKVLLEVISRLNYVTE